MGDMTFDKDLLFGDEETEKYWQESQVNKDDGRHTMYCLLLCSDQITKLKRLAPYKSGDKSISRFGDEDNKAVVRFVDFTDHVNFRAFYYHTDKCKENLTKLKRRAAAAYKRGEKVFASSPAAVFIKKEHSEEKKKIRRRKANQARDVKRQNLKRKAHTMESHDKREKEKYNHTKALKEQRKAREDLRENHINHILKSIQLQTREEGTWQVNMIVKLYGQQRALQTPSPFVTSKQIKYQTQHAYNKSQPEMIITQAPVSSGTRKVVGVRKNVETFFIDIKELCLQHPQRKGDQVVVYTGKHTGKTGQVHNDIQNQYQKQTVEVETKEEQLLVCNHKDVVRLYTSNNEVHDPQVDDPHLAAARRRQTTDEIFKVLYFLKELCDDVLGVVFSFLSTSEIHALHKGIGKANDNESVLGKIERVLDNIHTKYHITNVNEFLWGYLRKSSKVVEIDSSIRQWDLLGGKEIIAQWVQLEELSLFQFGFKKSELKCIGENCPKLKKLVIEGKICYPYDAGPYKRKEIVFCYTELKYLSALTALTLEKCMLDNEGKHYIFNELHAALPALNLNAISITE